ncbi:MAG: SOS response-associated peptidase family protein [Halobacteriovoraceae bacterium]|nr:SOS response-associated peptidase family protein [Halobacteriovoraceae bacterium]
MCFSIEVDRNIKRLSGQFEATADAQAFADFLSFEKQYPKIFKRPQKDNRLYPNYSTPILLNLKNQLTLRPFRYRIRPNGSPKEIPSKYNLFNARLDSLESRKTWKGIFMRNHCLVPYLSFYEWVEDNGKKRLIHFFSKDDKYLMAPGLYDRWISPDKSYYIDSFAIITTNPPTEIEQAGHDRCPIFIKEEYYNEWLNPKMLKKKDAFEILKDIKKTHYSHEWA